jgi:hypothetical protein
MSNKYVSFFIVYIKRLFNISLILRFIINDSSAHQDKGDF